MTPNVAEQTPGTPAKRGRGRPRKTPLPDPAESEPASQPSAVTPETITAKRGRGRPRKNPLPEPALPEPAQQPVEAPPKLPSLDHDSSNEKPPHKRWKEGKYTKEEKEYQRVMWQALKANMLDVREQSIKVLEAVKRPLEEADLEGIIALEITDAELERQWDESPENEALSSSGYLRPMAAWKICLRKFRCSPLAIITPLRKLVYEQTPSNSPFYPLHVSPVWGQTFWAQLSILLTHPVWMGDAAVLAMFLQFAVICRTDDRRVWETPTQIACPVFDRLRAALRNAEDGPLPVPVRDMLRTAMQETTEAGYLHTPYSRLLRTLGGLIDAEEGESTSPTVSQGLEVYAVQMRDLRKVVEAIDAVGPEGYVDHVPTQMTYENYMACRITNDIPRGRDQIVRLFRREWIYQQKAIADRVAEMGQ
ncbi:hypothetical protein BKA56DRAFT_667833 [Ilyonectria sp. MPI-CAGE-AT-0026]|nr:hypothetical protein BKA56DRAFT_667833 [Ilyonectria sp. MPI-CAGE-AT-0026]